MTLISLLSAFHLPLLHAGWPPPNDRLLNSHWHLDPMVALFVFGVTTAYLAWVGPLNRRRPGVEERPVTPGQIKAFLAGSFVLLIAVGPPLHDWAHFYLVSAHMVQHLLLIMVVAPLWLIGIPAWVYRPLLRWRFVERAGYVLTRSLAAFILPTLVVIVWHVPVLYNAALRSDVIHLLEHQMFLLTALLVWWPVLGRVPEWPRLSPPLQCLYLALLTLPGGGVGAVITMAEPGLYDHYTMAPRLWGMSLGTDQEVAGLIMWVGTNTVYLLLITTIFLRWASREVTADREQAATGNQVTSRQPRSHQPSAVSRQQ